jgi:hypothetical protein
MRFMLRGRVLLVGACLMIGLAASAQAPGTSESAHSALEVGGSYGAARANTVAGREFWMQGGSVQLCGQFTRNWGVAADLTGLHTASMPGTSAGLGLFTAAFGPRYTLTSHSGRFKVFGEALGGVADGFNSIFPGPIGATSSASGFVVQIGGGLDYRISGPVFVRMLDASWLRTELSNGTTEVQDNMLLGSGVAYRF